MCSEILTIFFLSLDSSVTALCMSVTRNTGVLKNSDNFISLLDSSVTTLYVSDKDDRCARKFCHFFLLLDIGVTALSMCF